jgi:STE24 endopeptidase
VLLSPLFNTFTPLERGALRSDVLRLADEAGVQVGEVYVMDASRRTTAANAYVAGLGTTKRVVIYDTLIDDFTPAETRLVVAHELGHVHYRDVPHGLLYLLIVAPLGMLAVARIAERLTRRDASPVPAVVLAIALMLPAITMISNQLSRAVEARADRYSMELTDRPDALIDVQKRIAIQNVSDPSPPGWSSALLGTHPTTMQRIGQAVAFRDRQARAARPAGGAAPREGS